MKVYFDLFQSINDLCSEFTIDLSELNGCEILYAEYNTDSYSGDTKVIFVKNNILYEVVGSHCSCSGLEGQWEPYKSDFRALLARPNVPPEAKDNLKNYYKNLLPFL